MSAFDSLVTTAQLAIYGSTFEEHMRDLTTMLIFMAPRCCTCRCACVIHGAAHGAGE
jgi:hypothetical protein